MKYSYYWNLCPKRLLWSLRTNLESSNRALTVTAGEMKLIVQTCPENCSIYIHENTVWFSVELEGKREYCPVLLEGRNVAFIFRVECGHWLTGWILMITTSWINKGK